MAAPPRVNQSWVCPDGVNSSDADVTADGSFPDSVGREEKSYTWVTDGCGIITGRRVIHQPVTLNITFPVGEPCLALRMLRGGQMGASLRGAGRVVETENRYSLNWVRETTVDVEYQYTPGTAQTLLFGFSTTFLQRALNGIGRPQQVDSFLSGKGQNAITTVNASVLTRGIPDLIHSNPYDGDLSRLYLQGQMFNLLAGVFRSLEDGRDHDRRHSDKANAKVRGVCDLLRSDLGRLPPLEMLAAAVGLSQRQLARTFRASTGRTVVEWVVERRLEEASRLLAAGELPVKEISYRAGYAHVASFTAAFSRQFGVPPAEYRRTIASRHFVSGG